MADYCSHRPRAYAVNKRSAMLERWNSEAGDAVRAYGPRIWPGIPPQALLAFGSNSTGPTEAIRSAGFWEIGLFNTPAGSNTSSPPPTGGAWVRIANSEEVQSLLGRPATTSPSAWRTALTDQTVIGLIDYRDGIQNVARRIPAALQPSGPPYTQWAWALGVFGYVESNGAVSAINRVADQLVRYPERCRFGALLGHLAEVGPTTAQAYPLARAWQRFEIGKQLALDTGGDVGWFELCLGSFYDAVEHRITVAKYGQPRSSCPPLPGAEGPVGTEVPSEGLSMLGWGLLGVAALAGLKIAYDRSRR